MNVRLGNKTLFAATLAVLCLPLLGLAEKGEKTQKNVILFVTDDQGQDAGCYGNPVIQTPNMDAIAADGTRFDLAFCTTASCSASRSVILTGMYNHANGHYGHEHSYHKFSAYPQLKSLPVYLEDAGYRTARIGKYHVAPEKVFHFQSFLKGNSRSPVEMADYSAEWIKENPDQPFFLYFCTSDPHRSGGTVPGAKHNPNPFGNRPQGYPGVEEVTYEPEDVVVPPYLPDTPVCRAELAQYYQSVSRIDQGLGKLISHLKELGKWENTMIIYISDHGIAFPGGKTTTYEPGLRSPCLVRNPFQKERGNVCDAMVSWIDLTPTILDYAGALPKKSTIQGRSFLEVMDQEKPKGWDEIYASHTFHEITMYYPMRVLRERQYKLIWNIAYPLPYPFASDLWAAPTFQDRYQQGLDTYYGKRTVGDYMQRPEFELYDLVDDPHESRNLALESGYTQILERMKAKLKNFQEKAKDPWILKWEYE
ncbi:N-sulfoglucosamine sulfohydrolase [Planctomycetales bacterium 10988]|nr:N-sulfoglucosamine sulfohydrolase [Planctomycetales bacterium 10988]